MSDRWRLCVALLLIVLVVAQQPTAASWLSLVREASYSYERGSLISIMAGSFTSKSKLVPLAWKDVMTCVNSEDTRLPRNIGQVLLGDSVVNSGYTVHVLANEACKVLCKQTLTPAEHPKLKSLINGNYRGNLFIDGLPAVDEGAKKSRVVTGYRIGTPVRSVKGASAPVLNNHLTFSIYYHGVSDVNSEIAGYRIVKFGVTASSRTGAEQGMCNNMFSDSDTSDSSVTYTYSVEWIPSKMEWSSRWDAYMRVSKLESRAHWLTVVVFFLIVAVHSVVLWFILVRMLRKDITNYNKSNEDPLLGEEDNGWKIVSGDVFCKPSRASLYAVLVGTGVQLACMLGSTLFIAGMGFIAPYTRGWLVSAQLGLFVLFSFVNGVVTAVLIKMFKVRSWKTILMTAILFPACIFGSYLTLNFIHLGSHATSTLPFSSLLLLLTLWLCLSMPLCLIGGAVGFSVPVVLPCKVNNIPRTIPPQHKYMKSSLSWVAPGLIPFAASYVEVQYIFASIWQGNPYYLFGFLAAVYALVIVLVAQVSVFSTYYQLNNLDYRWWWRSFAVSGSYAVWLMVYCVYYYLCHSIIKGFWGTVLYFGYMAMASGAVGILLASMGVLASLAFVGTIYSSLKLD